MYSPQPIENIHDIGLEIAEFNFALPPTTLNRFKIYLTDKLNEALFIRDHYSVKYIINVFNKLRINYDAYQSRLEKL